MHPIISVDAAHLKSAYKGMIFIYSWSTGNDEAYILAFGVSGGNEDDRTWNTFNMYFAKACPSVSFVEDDHAYSKSEFVSDRDKGLDKSLSKIFPKESCNKLWSSYYAECENTVLSKGSRNGFPNCSSFFDNPRRHIIFTATSKICQCL